MDAHSRPRFYSLWAINGPLDPARLHRQLKQFKAAGLDGVVWHPRFYPGGPPYLGDRYLGMVSTVILQAKALGLAFWIYDEDGWPSGTVGGRLLRQYPQDAQRWAGLVRQRPRRCLAEFERDGERWYLGENTGPGVDYLNPELARHFIELTYERYRTGLAPAAFAHVEAFFCDEPEFGLGHAHAELPKAGGLPWTPRLPELFRTRHGEELSPLVPLLFFPGKRAAEVRVKFWELITEMFCDAFVTPLNDWCRRQGKRFTAHVKGEEHPLFQVPLSGSCHQVFRRLGLPGIDALERYPANDFYPRQVSAVARQFGDGRCMVEAFGGSGWGATPEDLERYLLWLGRNGLTDFVLHLSQYRLDSAAMQDWPPSQPLHLSWSHLYSEVIGRVRAELTARPRPPADTLVVAPYRGIMRVYSSAELLETNIHTACTYPDTKAGRINRAFIGLIGELQAAGVAYDVADERTVETFGMAAGGRFRLGACAYRRVIVASASRLDRKTRAAVRPFMVAAATLTSASPGVKATPPAPPTGTVSLAWKLSRVPVNALLLECVAEKGGWFSACFANEVFSRSAQLKAVFIDDLDELTVNGSRQALTRTAGGWCARMPVLSAGFTRLRFRLMRSVRRPWVWLQGPFRVRSADAFRPGPGGTLQTAGPFTVEPGRTTLAPNLIADGFPFLGRSLVATTTVRLPRAVKELHFCDGVADAVRLFANERDHGWTWTAEHGFRFAVDLPAGEHRLRVEFVPNAFNTSGPHHYYGGDWFVISPAQMQGERNFADPADAPAMTHVAAWHFRRFELPTRLGWSCPGRGAAGGI